MILLSEQIVCDDGVATTFTVDGGTVKVARQVVINGAQVLVYVKVTVVEPPQLDGAPVLLFVSTPLHPPLADTVASHAAKAVFIVACV